MKKKTAVDEATEMLRNMSVADSVLNSSYTVVEAAVALNTNINVIRGIVSKGRPFKVQLSGRTQFGHRGFRFWDLLMLRLGRRAMEYRSIPASVVNRFVTSLRADLQTVIAAKTDAVVSVTPAGVAILSEADYQDLAKVEAFSKRTALAGPGLLFSLTVEIVDLTERLCALREHRPYREPEIAKATREAQEVAVRNIPSIKQLLSSPASRNSMYNTWLAPYLLPGQVACEEFSVVDTGQAGTSFQHKRSGQFITFDTSGKPDVSFEEWERRIALRAQELSKK